MMEGCKGLIEAPKLGQGEGLVDQRGHAIRSQGDGLVEPWQRVFVPAQQLQRRADIVAGLVIERVQRMRPQKIGQGVFVLFHVEQHEATLFDDGRLMRAQVVAAIEVRQRLVEPSELEQNTAAAIERVCMGRVELQDMLIADEAFGIAVELGQCVAVMDPQPGIVRSKLQGAIQGVERVAVKALLVQRDAEAAKIIRLAILPAGAIDPRDRVVVLPGLQAQKAHQMQGFGVIGVEGQRLLAAKLRIQGTACLHMPVGKLIKCSRCRGAGPRGLFGRLSGAAFTAVHRGRPPARNP